MRAMSVRIAGAHGFGPALAGHWRSVCASRVLPCIALTLAACQTGTPLPIRPLSAQAPTVLSQVSQTVPSSLRVPLTVERLAIFYPKTSTQMLVNAYARLTAATFQIKEQRPSLRVLERLDLPALHQEQRFQLSGAVSDKTALRVGRLLGVDSVLLFQIEEPTLRDRVMARYYSNLPPFTVTSKIVMVESGEVVYLNVVTAMVGYPHLLGSRFSGEAEMDVQLRAALDRGVVQTIADLRWAFRSTY